MTKPMNLNESEKPIRVFVAGHRGMVGSAIVKQLQPRPDIEIITRSRGELDLLNQAQVGEFIHDEAIDQIYLCAAKVGGIHANNTFPGFYLSKPGYPDQYRPSILAGWGETPPVSGLFLYLSQTCRSADERIGLVDRNPGAD